LAISGDANEDQILQAATMYQNRPKLLTKVIYALNELLRHQVCTQIARAIDAILVAMEKHRSNNKLQLAASASLFFIAVYQHKQEIRLGPVVKNRIALTLLDGMSFDHENRMLMENGFLILHYIRLPKDLVRKL